MSVSLMSAGGSGVSCSESVAETMYSGTPGTNKYSMGSVALMHEAADYIITKDRRFTNTTGSWVLGGHSCSHTNGVLYFGWIVAARTEQALTPDAPYQSDITTVKASSGNVIYVKLLGGRYTAQQSIVTTSNGAVNQLPTAWYITIDFSLETSPGLMGFVNMADLLLPDA